jgi:hypothetical protein
VQLVGQIMSHLRSEVRPYTRGGDLEDTVMLDQSYLPTRVIAHRDLVGADAMNVCAHYTPPFATQYPGQRRNPDILPAPLNARLFRRKPIS